MGKTAVFAVTCSIVIFALFGVSCFLMTTVNPPPMAEVSTEKNDKALRFGNNPSNFYLRNIDPSDILEYGLEKAYNPSGHSSPAPVHLRNITKDLPSVKMKNPHLVKVHPPIFPPKTSNLTSKEFKPTTETITVHKNSTNVTKESQIHRRSINVIDKNKDNTGAVILKILDNDGKSRIEIKLNPNDVFGNKKSRPHRSFIKTDTELKEVELSNTVIKILPNDTLIINNDNSSKTIGVRMNSNKSTMDDSETVYLTNILYPTESNANIYKDIKANKNIVNRFKTVNEEILSSTEINEETMDIMNTKSSTTNFGLKVMFDNVTRSFTEPYDKNDFQNKTDKT